MSNAASASQFIKGGQQLSELMSHHQDAIEAEGNMHATIGNLTPGMLCVAVGTALLVMFTVLAVFYVKRDEIRRIVRGENRRVGSVYYVKPGMSASIPADV
jgi:hypothetical protein